MNKIPESEKFLDIATISATSLRKGDHQEVLSGLYALKPVIENGPWHERQSVFDHTVLVYEGYLNIEDLLERNSPKIRDAVKLHFSERVGDRNRFELGAIAILFHDVAKLHTNTLHSNGTTSNPLHEIYALGMLDDLLTAFKLSGEQIEWIKKYVMYHGLVSQTIGFSLASEKEERIQRLFFRIVGDQAIDLLIFIWCDLLGSDLKKSDLDLFTRFQQKILQILEQVAVAYSDMCRHIPPVQHRCSSPRQKPGVVLPER